MKENKNGLSHKNQNINKYDKAILTLKHLNYNSLIEHYGLELSQGIIRLFKEMNIEPGEKNEVVFKDKEKRQISKYGISMFYGTEESEEYMSNPFDYEGKKYQIYYSREEYNFYHQLEPTFDYVRIDDIHLLTKLYNYLQYHYIKQKQNQK